MAVYSIHETTGGNVKQGERGDNTYSRKFQIVMTEATASAATVVTATGVPQRGAMYIGSDGVSDSTSVVKEVSANQDSENPRLWTVSVDYGPPSGDESQNNPDPFKRAPVVSWGHSEFTRVVTRDVDGKAFLNSAGDAFAVPPEVPDSRPQLNITRNERVYSPAIALEYQNTVNEKPFMGAPAGTCRLTGITASNAHENNVAFWVVNYAFEFARDGWLVEVLDQGMRALNDENKLVRIRALDEQGEPQDGVYVPHEVPLNGSGKALLDPNPENVQYRTFKVFKDKDFSQLRLP